MTTTQHERFHLGARVFDVTEAKRLLATEGPAEVRTVPVENLTPLLDWIGVWPDDANALPDEALDAPIIAVLDVHSETGRTKPLLIDGYHRVYAANARGRETLTMHVLNAEQSKRVEKEPRW